MKYDFDTCPDRRLTESIKWKEFGADVLPMWVADMDFVSPAPVIEALQKRVEHGVFGYPGEDVGLKEAITGHLSRRFDWYVEPEAVVLLPGVVTGFNLACQAFAGKGGGVLIQTPVYMPFLTAPRNAGAIRQEMLLTRNEDGRYSVDMNAFEAAFTPETKMFLLCSPHNPVGRVYTRDELAEMAEICERKNVVICSDEIHADLVFSGGRQTPMGAISPEAAKRTVTLMAPSKTFNLPGLYCSFAVIPDEMLRKQFNAARHGVVGEVNLLGLVGAEAAYRDGAEWLDQLLIYLEGNRDFLFEYVKRELPMLTMAKPEGTYLAWLDCRRVAIQGTPQEFFLKQAKVAFNDGAAFGKGGEGFIRMNFGCPRAQLAEALDRMKKALTQ